MQSKQFLKGLTRNILIVGLVSLFTDMSSQMVFPLIPLYLVSIGSSAWIIGLVEGAAESTASILKFFQVIGQIRFKEENHLFSQVMEYQQLQNHYLHLQEFGHLFY